MSENPALSTDQADYTPGSTVTLTGTGWLPGEAIHIFVNDNVGSTWSYSTDVTSDKSGGFVTTFQISSSLIAQYKVTATGTNSDSATVLFTDNVGFDLSQCSNGVLANLLSPCGDGTATWQHGDINGQNSQYREGDGLPYRGEIGGLTDGDWFIGLVYDFTKGGVFALDRLARYQLTQASDPCGTGAAFTCDGTTPQAVTGPIPFNVASPDATHPSVPNTLHTWNVFSSTTKDLSSDGIALWSNCTTVTSTGIDSNVVQNGLSTGDSSRQFAFKIHLSGCPTTGKQGQVIAAWTGHIASDLDWGTGKGAASISGAPFHMGVVGVDQTDGTTGGEKDRSVQLSALVSTLEVIKHLVPSTDSGTFNLLIDSTQTATPVGDGGSLGPLGVTASNGGTSHTVSETGANGTLLSNYTTTISCHDAANATVTATSNGTDSWSVPVVTGQNVVCDVTNTRKSSIELRKAWVGTAGQTTLNIGTTAGGSQTASQLTGAAGAAPLTTGSITVPTGTFFVSETGGLTSYDSSLACFNDNGAGGGTAGNGIKDGTEPTVTPGTNNSVTIAAGDHIICTFTNTRQQGTIELKKVWSGTAGQTTLNIGTTAGGTDTASQQTGAAGAAPLTTGQKTVDTGTFFVSETGGLTNYDSSLACFNDNGAGSGGVANDRIQNGTEPTITPGTNNSVSVGKGDHIVCTFTNTRQQGTIELKKVWSGTPGQTTLNIGTTSGGSQVKSQQTGAAGAAPLTTGQQTVDTGTFFVSETGGLTNYDSSLACFNDNGLGTGATANNGIQDGSEPTVTPGTNNSVAVGKGDHIICTFTNTRKTGTIELKKVWVGEGGQTTLNIGTSAGGTQTASQQTGVAGAAPLTTGEKTVDTGTYFVSETGGLTNFDSSLACFNDNGAGGGTADNGTKDGTEPTVTPGANNSVAVAKGDHIICTFTNTKRAHLTLTKLENGQTPTIVYSFTLTGGPDNVNVTKDTSSGNNLDFGFVKPGTYQLCETNVPAGTTPVLTAPTGYVMVLVDATTGKYCLDVAPAAGTAQFDLTAGQNLALTIDDQHPQGGQRTIGYWKNWNSCSHDGSFVARSLKTGNTLLDKFLPITLVPDPTPLNLLDYNGDTVSTCQQAVIILGDAAAKYAENQLAAQLLAAILNVDVGAGCGTINTTIAHAQSLLAGIQYNGNSGPTSLVGNNSPIRADVLATANTLNTFNNGQLC